ncbi:MAG: CaiB/BaiF CoA-transferase family protein [Chloroflexi bacterium]|nr:CaiB/BaiF CoA-transferase family protein [Chloroflexota bacterium]
MPGPLEGIKVFEVSQIVAGPYCGLNLVDLGADVVKVEPPGGEGIRASGGFVPGESKGFHALNRGKRSLVMDLQAPAAQELVHRLIAGFDVFVINARPGVPERLRVDYQTLRAFRPDLIYFENTGFGRQGPSALRSGSDAVAQAYSGLLAGDGKVDAFGAPEIITATAPADFHAGLAGAMGISAALFHRERTGQGQYIETSLLLAGLALQGTRIGKLPAIDAQTSDKALERMYAVQAAGGSYGDLIAARGNLFDQMGRAAARLFYGGYAVKDGGIVLGALTPLNREQMRRAIGVEDDPTSAPDFDSMDPENHKLVDQMLERIRAIMLTKTMDEWAAEFDREGAPMSRVNFPEELAGDPQVQAMGYMVNLEHELTGPETMVGPIVTMSETPTGSDRPSPTLGRHSDEVLREHGVGDEEIAALRASGVVA